MFKLMRTDAAILIIPNEYVEELRSLPEHQLSPRRAHVDVGVFTSAPHIISTRNTTNLTYFIIEYAREIYDYRRPTGE